MFRLAAANLLLVALSWATAGAAVTFVDPPTAQREGATVKIAFRVSAPTDVEVALLDSQGKVVRHLGAAKLSSAPPPPFQPGLRQELVWDGNDDAGRPAEGGPYRCRVRLGLTASLDKIVGWSGQQLGTVRGLACGPQGTLFVVYGGGLYAHRQTTLISAFDRDGRYLRQIFPGPANLPAERKSGWPHVLRDDGCQVPVVHQLLSRCIYPGAVFGNRAIPTVTGDGRLVFVSGAAEGSTIKHADVRGGRRLLLLGGDGSVPADFLGPIVAPAHYGGFGRVAVSPDNQWAYVTGLFEGGKAGKGFCNVVWRVPLDGSQPAEVFVGKLFEAGAGPERLDDPQGMTTDAAGNLYVADYGNHRIGVFDPRGELVGELPVEFPDSIQVSRRTGTVYVLTLHERTKPITDGHYYAASHNWRPARIVKFTSHDQKSPAAQTIDLQQGKYGGGAFFALDDSATPPVLWICGRTYQGGDVYQVADRGNTLEIVGRPIKDRLDPADQPLPFVGDVAVSGDQVMTRGPTFRTVLKPDSLVFSARSGQPLAPFVPRTAAGKRENYWNLVYGEMTSGKDGRVYFHTDDRVRRYEPDGTPAPFDATGSHDLENLRFDRHTHNSTLFAANNGTIYVAAREAKNGQALDEDVLCIQKISSAGDVLDARLIRVQAARLGGLAADSRGNIYLGAQVFGADRRIPDWVRDRLPEDSEHHHPGIAYANCGAIVKFPPGGGSISLTAESDLRGHRQAVHPVAVSGSLIARAGLVPGKSWQMGAGCNCEVTRFDIDSFDRLFVPDPLRFCVLVLDTNGQEITRFGVYGNMDSRGAGSPVPTPGIPLGWPLTARAADGRVFVADLVNRRIVAVALKYTETATCTVE